MPKDTFYFPHDYDATDNLKIAAMIAEFGSSGYGLYWRIIEMLHKTDIHKLPVKNYVYSGISKQMGTDVEHVLNFVQKCSKEYELFEMDTEFFWSDRVFKNIEKRNEIKELKREAGKKSGEVRRNKGNTNEQNRTRVEQNRTKESKEKSNQTAIESSISFIEPLLSEVILFFDEHGYTKESATEAFEYYSKRKWYNSKNYPVLNWKNTMEKNWFDPKNLKPVTIMPREKSTRIDHSNQDLSEWR